MNTIIEKIRAEVERLKLEARENCPEQTINRNYTPTQWQAIGEYNAYEIVGLFLSDLEKEEKPMKQEGLEEELDKWRHDHFHGKRDDHFSGEYLERTSQLDFARHFAQWGAEHLKK